MRCCVRLHRHPAGLEGLNINCRRIFEAIMRTKGHTNFTITETGRYTVPSLQTRWTYFEMGWELAKA